MGSRKLYWDRDRVVVGTIAGKNQSHAVEKASVDAGKVAHKSPKTNYLRASAERL